MFENNLLAGVSGQGGGYNIEDSLRFNDNDSAYLSRTPSVAGNRKKWTWSGWVKRGNVGDTIVGNLFSVRDTSTTRTVLRFNGDSLDWLDDDINFRLFTSAKLRDAGGWYHIVATADTTQATTSDRLKIYINGVRVSSFSTSSYPSQNYETEINNTRLHALGVEGSTTNDYFDGYMAEVNFIDGQALTADDFGEINEDTGEWSPKKYSGTYGTNGFYLPFNGNANDSSGNGNNWTENNLASTDYMIDTPTNNFSVLNSIANLAALSEGNLKLTNDVTGSWQSAVDTLGVSSGKWYFEACSPTTLSNPPYADIGITTNPSFGLRTGNNYLGVTSDSWGYVNTGAKYTNSASSSYGASYTAGDVIGCALDMDAGTVTFYKNNVSQGTAFTGLTGTMFCGISVYAASGTTNNYINFGSDSSFAGSKTRQGNTDANGIGDFYYTPPTGYLALCTDNLPEPAIVDSESHFNVVTWTGTGSTQAITGVGFQPDFVWIKSRNYTYNHWLFDSVRGAGNLLAANTTGVEASYPTILSSFDSDGFTTDSNGSNFNFVAWCWKAGGTAVTNTDGSITSQVSANVDAGFSIATYASGSGTVGHGLSKAPEIVIEKKRDATSDWFFSHTLVDGSYDYLRLNLTNANSNAVVAAPTSTVFTPNVGSNNVVAYCFHSVEGFSKFGSYVGNGSADGPFVYTGFKPAFVLYKRATGGTGNWILADNEREGYNWDNPALYPNLNLAESSGSSIDILSNGFKVNNAIAGSDHNASGSTYIYMAFAEHPFNYATGR